MTLETRSFFLGIATVAGLLVVGFGGGILMGGVLTGDNNTPNKIERQAAAKVETPVQPAIAEAQVKPVPVVDAKPAVNAAPAEALLPVTVPPPPQPVLRTEAAPLPFAPPQQTTQPEPAKPVAPPEQKTAAGAATSVDSSTSTGPVLGPQRPVALTQPPAGEQVRPLSRREEARIRKEQRRAEQAQRREERRKLAAERREREMARREEMRSERVTRRDFDDDEDDERTIVREHRPRAPDLPFFRIFN
jgi:hypothetical protein